MSSIGTGDIRAKVPESMLFFKKPEVNVGQLRQHYAYVYPRNRLDVTSQSAVEFSIQDGTSDFINLDELELQMIISITKKNNYRWKNGDGGTPPDKKAQFKDEIFPAYMTEENVDLAVPIDGFFQTQWKDVEMTMNDTEVAKTNRDFSYRSYIDMMLRTTDEEWPLKKYKEL